MTTILLGAGASIPFFSPQLTTDYLTESVKNQDNWEKVINKYNRIPCDAGCRRSIPSIDEIMSLLDRITTKHPTYNFEKIAEVLDKYCSIIIDVDEQKTMLSSIISLIGISDSIIQQDNRWKDVPFLFREIIADTIIDLQINKKCIDYDEQQRKQVEWLQYICEREETVTIASLNYDDSILQSAVGLNFTNGFTFNEDKGFMLNVSTLLQSKRVLLFPHGHLRFLPLNDCTTIEWYHNSQTSNDFRWNHLFDTITDGTSTHIPAVFAYNFNTFITTGQTKDDSLNNEPFAAYYQRMAKDIMDSNRIIIIGYSFSDEHLNRLLKLFFYGGSDNKVLIVDRNPNKITMTEEYKSPDNMFVKLQCVFSREWSIRVDSDGVKHPAKQKEIDMVNKSNFGEIFDNVFYYKGGYDCFLNEYRDILHRLYSKTCV